jgi:hypothetical protein
VLGRLRRGVHGRLRDGVHERLPGVAHGRLHGGAHEPLRGGVHGRRAPAAGAAPTSPAFHAVRPDLLFDR